MPTTGRRNVDACCILRNGNVTNSKVNGTPLAVQEISFIFEVQVT